MLRLGVHVMVERVLAPRSGFHVKGMVEVILVRLGGVYACKCSVEEGILRARFLISKG